MDLHQGKLGLRDAVPRTEAVGVFFHAEGHFPIEIPARPEKPLTIRELHAVAEITLFLKAFSLRTKLLRVRKNLCANVGP
jgi:hypothetical protein